MASGPVPAGREYTDSPDTSAVVSSVDTIVSNDGLTPESVRVLQPLDDAVAVVASVSDDSAATGKLAQLETDLAAQSPGYGGVFIEIDDESGPIGCVSTAPRVARGHFWQSPDSDVDLGIAHG